MQPKLVIFDWDGTLADTTNPIIQTTQQTFIDCGYAAPEADAIRTLIGYSLPRIIQQLAPNLSTHQYEELIEVYTAHHFNPNNQNMQLFPSAISTLQTLQQQGYWLAVATGKGRNGLNKAIEQTQTADFWLATTCASECPSKPAPDMVFKLCEELGVMPSESVVVGDTTFDMEMAYHAGAHGVAVCTGAHSREALAQSPQIAILTDLAQLPDFLKTI